MGFLDRMVADLIGDATGLPVKRLVRKAGVSKLLIAGGAAAAVAYAAQKMSEGRDGGAASTPPPPPGSPPPTPPGAAPPLPPVPGAAAPPADLPPLPTAAAEEELAAELTFAVVRTMVAAALADGELAAAERRSIQDHLAESGLAPAQVEQVHRDLLVPATPAELAGMVGDPGQRTVLYRAAILVALADDAVADGERAWLARFGEALGLDPTTRAEVERELIG